MNRQKLITTHLALSYPRADEDTSESLIADANRAYLSVDTNIVILQFHFALFSSKEIN